MVIRYAHRLLQLPQHPPTRLRAFLFVSGCIAPFSSTACTQVKKRMPPKKAAEPEKKTLLGRPSNNLKIGIVGLSFRASGPVSFSSNPSNSIGVPNVGKSSFFNALSETGTSFSFIRLFVESNFLNFTQWLDLGKAANFPYATINPEVSARTLFPVSSRTKQNFRKRVYPSLTRVSTGSVTFTSQYQKCQRF